MAQLQTLAVKSDRREVLVNITRDVTEAVSASGVKEGVAIVYCPHTTGAITIQEAADPDVAVDISNTLTTIVPYEGNYRHAEGNSDSHLKAALVGSSDMIPIEDGRLRLGTWQGIFFCEFDGPRDRKVLVKVLEG
jgi:secondary thiamine-phosphate synthase enzyme